MATLTKKRKAAVAKFDGTKLYDLSQATEIVKQVSAERFSREPSLNTKVCPDASVRRVSSSLSTVMATWFPAELVR